MILISPVKKIENILNEKHYHSDNDNKEHENISSSNNVAFDDIFTDELEKLNNNEK